MMKAINKAQLTNLLLNAYGFADDYGILITHESLLEEDAFSLDQAGEIVTCLYEEAEIQGSLLRVMDASTGEIRVLTVLVPARCEELLEA